MLPIFLEAFRGFLVGGLIFNINNKCSHLKKNLIGFFFEVLGGFLIGHHFLGNFCVFYGHYFLHFFDGHVLCQIEGPCVGLLLSKKCAKNDPQIFFRNMHQEICSKRSREVNNQWRLIAISTNYHYSPFYRIFLLVYTRF